MLHLCVCVCVFAHIIFIRDGNNTRIFFFQVNCITHFYRTRRVSWFMNPTGFMNPT